jgi:hypothetical protein
MGESEAIKKMRRRPGAIISKPATDKYREGYDRIFKKGENDEDSN